MVRKFSVDVLSDSQNRDVYASERLAHVTDLELVGVLWVVTNFVEERLQVLRVGVRLIVGKVNSFVFALELVNEEESVKHYATSPTLHIKIVVLIALEKLDVLCGFRVHMPSFLLIVCALLIVVVNPRQHAFIVKTY